MGKKQVLNDILSTHKVENELITRKTNIYLPFCLIALIRVLSSFCFSFFPEDEINKPLANSMEMSKSPELVNRLETNDPNGSTVAPIFAKHVQVYH